MANPRGRHADDTTDAVFQALNQSYLTPIDREDIGPLAFALDFESGMRDTHLRQTGHGRPRAGATARQAHGPPGKIAYAPSLVVVRKPLVYGP